jgi:hypothetical protein
MMKPLHFQIRNRNGMPHAMSVVSQILKNCRLQEISTYPTQAKYDAKQDSESLNALASPQDVSDA